VAIDQVATQLPDASREASHRVPALRLRVFAQATLVPRVDGKESGVDGV
jgi:hypothetical protein